MAQQSDRKNSSWNDQLTNRLDGSPQAYVDPATLVKIDSLELRAKSIVEGFFSGLHRSPFHGFSVEFTEYREYSVGDDLRHLDWKLFARRDRYYVKRYEDETNLRCYVLLDNSLSMSFGSVGYTKADYAKTLAATFGFFLSGQRDSIGLLRFSSELEEYLPARSRNGHFLQYLRGLQAPPSGKGSEIAKMLDQVMELVLKKGLMVLISDLLTPLNLIEDSVGPLRAMGHELIIFQILDPAEINFTFDQATQFVDAETQQTIYVNPQTGRSDYIKRFQAHQAEVRRICEQAGIHLVNLTTETPLEQALPEFLRVRQHSAAYRVRR